MRVIRLWLVLGVGLLAFCPPPGVLADGDPASDVLLAVSVFYPYSPPVSSSLRTTLNAETAAAKRAGFPIKVALISSPVDLGAIPDLFDKPQQYAMFLDQEISFSATKELLLVVMPNGYGVSGISSPAAAAVSRLAKPGGADGNHLARAAIAALPVLAAAAGHPIGSARIASPPGKGHGSPALTVVAIALAAVVAAATTILVRQRRGSRPTPGG